MNTGRFAVFFLLAMTVWTGAFLYVGARLIGPSGLAQPMRAIAWAALALVTYIGPLTIFSGRITPKPSWYAGVALVGYAAMGLVLLLLPLLVARDLGYLAAMVGAKARSVATGQSTAAMDPSRRNFLLNAVNLGLLAAVSLLGGFGYAAARRRPGVVHVEIPLDRLPAAFDGFKIAQISDLHLGASTLRREDVRSIVEEVNRENPDMVALTGDLADGYPDELREACAPLAELQAPHGKYFVTGNHEYYWDTFAWMEEVARLGFTHLLNEHRIMRRGDDQLVIAGVPDVTGADYVPEHVSDPEAAARGAPAGAARVLLAHQPRSCRAAARAGFDLQLSGHTHGGQFWPWTWILRLALPIIGGLHKFENLWIYVNRGTGTWGPPLRIGSPAEITFLTLRRPPGP